MYYPLLRGKQNELLALRELLQENHLSQHIIPIIEPVKQTSTFRLLLEQFDSEQRKFVIIQNSKVTDYVNFGTDEIEKIKQHPGFIHGYYLNDQNDFQDANQSVVTGDRLMGILRVVTDPAETLFGDSDIRLVVDPIDKRMMRYIQRQNVKHLIEISDYFNKQARNQDYNNNPDEFFSEEHLYYRSDGFEGFGDYSIVGEEFIENGFAAKAVAIHIVYFDSEDRLRVHHFVSNSNEDINNPAGKFAEALDKLIKWMDKADFDDAKNHSSALDEFKRLHASGEYPGLGIIKRLSVKHHLEIMGRFLEEREQ